MKLQTRLLALFSIAISVAILVFGIGIYFNVYRISLEQSESTLRIAANHARRTIALQDEMFFSSISSFDENIIIFVWDPDQILLVDENMQAEAESSWLEIQPAPDFESNEPSFKTIVTVNGDFHVYTLPVITESGQKLVLQSGMSLTSVYRLQEDLLQMMLISGGVVLVVAAIIAWLMTSRTLAPLHLTTQTALQITQTETLSIRIPETRKRKDEVGQLIQAFNTMLARMEEMFETQRRFLANVSHELRTPLTAIRGNASLMRRMKAFDLESLASIENEVGRMTRMVDDLLLLAQADAGKLPMETKPVELDTLMLEIFQQVRAYTPGQKSIVIDDIDQVIICGDSERLKQVMLNLIANAIKYTPDNAQIKLSLGKRGSAIYFKVEDNGPGIPEKDIPHIFDRFYRAEKSRSRNLQDQKGFGLGLSIANWIVTQHLGQIEVVSHEGVGTTFTVWLPLFEGECPPKPLTIKGIASSKTNEIEE